MNKFVKIGTAILFVWVCVLHPVYAFVPPFPFPYLHSPPRKLFLCTWQYVKIIMGTTY